MATITQSSFKDIQFRAAQLPVQLTAMEAMASKMWAPFIAMGFMIEMAAFIFGLVNYPISSDYYQFPKRHGKRRRRAQA